MIYLLTNVNRSHTTLDHLNETGTDIAALAFGLKDDAAAVRRA